MGTIIQLHGFLYHKEFGYGTGFESYVANGLAEFHSNICPLDRVWVCEKNSRICGFLLLQHRDSGSAQLRYFIISPECRGTGLGKWLMQEFMLTLKSLNYRHAYLWTTKELVTAAHLYVNSGFRITEEKQSAFFGKSVTEQRYDWLAAIT